MPHTVALRLKTGITGRYGDPSYGAVTMIACRYEKGTKTVRDDNGEERVATNVMQAVTEIPRGSRVWPPGADITDDDAAFEIAGGKQSDTIDGTTIFEAWD